MVESKFTIYSTRQNFLETCRVRFTHHRELKMNGFFLQNSLFWCAERTLQSPRQKLSRVPTSIILAGGNYE
jgi:hypothetical protein